jgi:hypothetical protein
LAISASDFILSLLDKAKKNLRAPHISFRDRSVTKVAATALVVLVSVSVIFSSWQAYLWVEIDQIHVPVGEACQYVTEHSALNETAVALCTSNLFNMYMMRFYLAIHEPGQRELWQYPENPVDAFEPQFNLTLLIEQSEALNVKYLLLYEHGNITFYETELRSHDVLETMLDTDRFVVETKFGSFPRQIFILRFLPNS